MEERGQNGVLLDSGGIFQPEVTFTIKCHLELLQRGDGEGHGG